jgi:hypothetical protein
MDIADSVHLAAKEPDTEILDSGLVKLTLETVMLTGHLHHWNPWL